MMIKEDVRKKASGVAVAIGTIMYALGVLVLHNELFEHLGMLIFAFGLIYQTYGNTSDEKEDETEK